MTRSTHTHAYEKFRTLLAQAREAAGMTQLEIANRLDRPQSFVAKYEGGERRLDVIEFLQVCNALEVSPHAVLTEMQNVVGV